MSKYINPLLDAGFKHIFGRQKTSEFLVFFINSLMETDKSFDPIESIELPVFTKAEKDCMNNYDMWLYLLKNLENMNEMPFTKANEVFERLSKVAEYANMSTEERFEYDRDLKAYRDWRNQTDLEKDQSYMDGIADGVLHERERMVSSMSKMGLDSEKIAKVSGLTVDEVENILGLPPF